MDDLLLLSTNTTDSKTFLKEPLAPIYTSFEGDRAPKRKTIFFCQNFPKKAQKRLFLTRLFKNVHAAQKIWPKQRPFSALGELWKSISSTLKKVVKKNAVPPEKILEQPLTTKIA